jgi:hypothetical protein
MASQDRFLRGPLFEWIGSDDDDEDRWWRRW